MRTVRFATLLFACCPLFASAQAIKRAQYPSLSPDGSTLLFSWQGDLWSVPSSGGDAFRITVHPAMDMLPKWTPDGKRIVFASNRFGNLDLFSISANGTDLERLTFDSANEYPASVTPDGRYVYGYTAIGRYDLFRVPIGGGEPTRMTNHPMESAYFGMLTPDGSKYIYNRGSYGPGSWRKPGVTGRAVGDIWIADNTVPLSNHRNLTSSDSAELFPLVASDRSITYVSNKSGWPNLWRMRMDGSSAHKITDHRDGTLRYPSINADGKLVAYEFESDIYLCDAATGQTRALEIRVPADSRSNPLADLSVNNRLSEWSIAPDSKRAAISVRGDVFLIPEKGGTTRQLTFSPKLDSEPVFIDPKSMVYVSARDGAKRELRKLTIEGGDAPFLSTGEDLFHPALSPDGKLLAFHMGLDRIAIVPVAGGDPKVVARGYFADAAQGAPAFSWSPDSKWLVVDIQTDRGSNVFLRSVETDEQLLVARTARGVSSTPKFLPNGRGIYFVASEFDQPDLFVVDLVPLETTFSEDDLDKLDAAKPPKPELKVEVALSGIENRMRRLTTGGASDAEAAPDSKSIWTNVDGQLVSIPITGGRATPVAGVSGSGTGLSTGPGGQKLYFWNGGKFASMPADKPGSPSTIPFEAQSRVNLRDEEAALFEEIWWAMDRFYYDDKFHGKDWSAIKAKFAKIVPFVYDRSDFYALMGEMMEELDSSHLGSTAPPAEVYGSDSTALLGVEWDPKLVDSRGVYVVASILEGSAASLPQSKLEIGDRILTVDGLKPSHEQPIAVLLNRKSGKKVRLGIERASKQFEVEIKPDSPAARSNLEYQNWVAWQRRTVDRLSGGKLAYFHIRGMDQPSYEQFLREIRTLTPGKQGGIIDVRYNGGGSTSHLVLGVLIKTPWLIRTTRGPAGIKISENIFRGDSLELPTALMINSSSYSNAEIMAEGFRRLIKGPIVGERTPGYVIGTGGYGLWDGGFIRMPAIGAYAIDGMSLENDGRRPDYDVPFDPDAWMGGRDPQTEKCVEELMKRIKSG